MPNLKPVTINVISNNGGLGDQIARIPAIRYCLENFDHVSLKVYWQDYFYDLAPVLYQHKRLKHFRLSEASGLNAVLEPVVDFDHNRVSPLSLSLVDHAFLILMDRLPLSESDRAYPFVGPHKDEKRIIFTVASTAPAREWPVIHINELARRVRAANFECVLLGNTEKIEAGDGIIQANIDPNLDLSLFTNLINKTTLCEALATMRSASAVVGVDNGLIHLAACTSVPIVCGYTSVEARLRQPTHIGFIAIEPKSPSYGYQSKSFAVNRDFRFPTDEEYGCNIEMSATRFADALNRLGIKI